MNSNDPYLAYYRHQQLGHGVSSVYQGAAYQRGHGVGSFLGGLFRTSSPLLKSGASAVGREALRTGVRFLGDIAAGTVRPSHAAGARFKEFTDTLKRKADSKMDRVLTGGGSYKKRRIERVTPQSLTRLLRASTKQRTPAKKKQRKTTATGKRKAKLTAVRKQRKNRRKVVQRRRRRGGGANGGDIFN